MYFGPPERQPYSSVTLSLTGGGGGCCLLAPLFSKRPIAQKVMKLNKFGKISYSTEIISALKLTTDVPSKNPFYSSNSWFFRPNLKFGDQNVAAVM
jgi:hypothetical protein